MSYTSKLADDTTTNIADQIPEEKRKEIALEACTQYDTDINDRSDWADKRDRYYKLWACHRDEKNTPWPNASNVCIPMLATACNQFHARSYQSIFAAPGMVKVLPVGKLDVDRAKNVETFMNWQTMYEMEEYEDTFDRTLQLLPINGLAHKKLFYNKDMERPVSEYISALDHVVPYKTKSLETAKRQTQKVWLYYSELVERNEKGLYIDFAKIIELDSGKDKTPAEELMTTADEVAGESQTSESEEQHLILEVHKKYKLDGKMKEYIFTVHYASQTLLRAVSREFEKGLVMHHFTDYHFLPNPEGYYSFGFGHFLEQLNEMANTTFNQIFDAGRLSNQPFGFYGRRAGIKSRRIKLHPGAMNEVDDASNIVFPQMQRLDQVLFQVLGQIQAYTEQFTSTSDYLTGRESKGTETPTAHGTLAIIEQGLVTFAVMTKRTFRSLRKELRLLATLNAIYLPDKKEYRVMEDTGKIAFPDIKRKDFSGKFDMIPIGDPSFASKGSRRQEATEQYQLLMGNPLVVGNPETGEGANMRGIYEVTSDLLDAYGRKNKSTIIGEPPPSTTSPEDENAMFMQGDFISPVEGEDVLKHLEVHERFLATPFFADMRTEYKELVAKHINETRQLAYKQNEKNLQLGGDAGVGGTGGGNQNVVAGPGNAGVLGTG